MTDVLEGVTILSEGIGYPLPFGAMIGLGVVGSACLCALMAGIIIAFINRDTDMILPCAICALLSVVFLTLVFISFKNNYPTYKVTIDDNVSFVEFNEKYEIIKQDGLIYEVKERATK